MHLFKFPLLFSKVGCILNSQLFRHMPSEIPDKQNAEIVKSVHHMCAPKVVKIGCFLTEIFKKGGRFEGHGVVEKCDDGGVMCWQFEGAISSGGRGVVHHLEVFHCEAPPHVHIPYYNAPCSSKSQRPRGLESCRKVIGAWAMGAKVRVPHTRATIKSNSKPLIDGTVRLIRGHSGRISVCGGPGQDHY